MRNSSPTEGRLSGSRAPSSFHENGGQSGLGALREAQVTARERRLGRNEGCDGRVRGSVRWRVAGKRTPRGERRSIEPTEAIDGVVKRRIPRVAWRLRSARGAGARSECVGKQMSVGRISRRARRGAARQAERSVLTGGKPPHRWCGWRKNEGETVRRGRAESIRYRETVRFMGDAMPKGAHSTTKSGHDRRHSGRLRPPRGGALQWETSSDLGESGEANHVSSPARAGRKLPRKRETRRGAVAAVRLEPARRCLDRDRECQRTVRCRSRLFQPGQRPRREGSGIRGGRQESPRGERPAITTRPPQAHA